MIEGYHGVKKSCRRVFDQSTGGLAQLGERLPCTQEVSGSIPLSSTSYGVTEKVVVLYKLVFCDNQYKDLMDGNRFPYMTSNRWFDLLVFVAAD